MARRAVVVLLLLAAFAVGCGDDDERPSADCLAGTPGVRAALQEAPAEVRLPDGSSLSSCVEHAREGADAQTVGSAYTVVATELANRMPASDAAALQLGYLAGATRRGAERTNGLNVELARRIEQAVGLDGPPADRRAAYRRGVRAGLRDG
jgi:hypothetical protein